MVKNISFLIIIALILLIFVNCPNDPFFKPEPNSNSTTTTTILIDQQWNNMTFPEPITDFTSRNDVLAMIKNNKYYLDAVYGNDETGDGSQAKPWKSIGSEPCPQV